MPASIAVQTGARLTQGVHGLNAARGACLVVSHAMCLMPLCHLRFGLQSLLVQKSTFFSCRWRLDDGPEAWKRDWHLSCRVRKGEAEASVSLRSNVADTERRGMEIYRELGLLTETEFDKLSGQTSSSTVLKLDVESDVPNQWGNKVGKFYIVSLEDLTCAQIHSMRRMKIYTDLSVSHEQLLLEAANQIISSQGSATFDNLATVQVKSLPRNVKDESGWGRILSLNELMDKCDTLFEKKNAKKRPADEAEPEEDQPQSDDDAGKVVQGPKASDRLSAKSKELLKRQKRVAGAGKRGVPKQHEEEEAASTVLESDLPKELAQVAAALLKQERIMVYVEGVPSLLAYSFFSNSNPGLGQGFGNHSYLRRSASARG